MIISTFSENCDGFDLPTYSHASGQYKIWPRSGGYWYFGSNSLVCGDTLNSYFAPSFNAQRQNFWESESNSWRYWDGENWQEHGWKS